MFHNDKPVDWLLDPIIETRYCPHDTVRVTRYSLNFMRTSSICFFVRWMFRCLFFPVCRRNVIRSNSSSGSTSNRRFSNMWAPLHHWRAKFRNWRYGVWWWRWKHLETSSHSLILNWMLRIKISGNWPCSRRTKIHQPKWHRPSKRTSSLRSSELIEAIPSFGVWCPKLAITSSLNLANRSSSTDTGCEAAITNTLLTYCTIRRLKYGRPIPSGWKEPLKSLPANNSLASVSFSQLHYIPLRFYGYV